MAYQPLVEQNPLRILSSWSEEDKMRMGLVMARAGLGKTALLVQIALDSILRGNQVIHVAIGESIDKTRAWYDDMVDLIAKEHGMGRHAELSETVQRNRMIMTFNESSFSRPRLEERLNDLILQDIFRPSCLVIDGYDFASVNRAALEDLRDMLETMNMKAWFTVLCHRDDTRAAQSGVPAPCHEVDDLFDTAVMLKPQDNQVIRLDIIKQNGVTGDHGVGLNLDPATMMVHKA